MGRTARGNTLAEARLHYLNTGERIGACTIGLIGYLPAGQTELGLLWKRVGKKMVRQHIRKHPGTRPFGWWYFADPRRGLMRTVAVKFAWPGEIQRLYLIKHDLLNK